MVSIVRTARRQVLSIEEFRTKLQLPNEWWVFFPLFGLKVAGPAALDRPLFGDATIVSYEAVRRLVRTAPGVMVDGKSTTESVLSLLTIERALEGEYHAAIGVRRRTTLGRSGLNAVPTGAVERARRIAAALTLAFAPHDQRHALVGLVEHASGRGGLSRILLARGVGVYSQSVHRSRPAAGPQGTMSRRALRRALRARDVAPYAAVLTAPRPTLPRSLHSAVTEAAIRFADALQAHEPAVQVLGAVTCLEILLCERSDYDVLRRRALLLAPEHATDASLKRLLEARHRYVHGGTTAAAEEVTSAAFTIARHVLARYATVARLFQCRADLLRFLDLEHARQRFGDGERGLHLALGRITRAGSTRHATPP